jgi:hypothetical protein
MKNTIEVPRELIINCLRRLESIVPSLARLGSFSNEASREEYLAATVEFMERWAVGWHLSKVRAALSGLLPYDELEQLFADVPRWRPSQPEPPAEYDRGPQPDKDED